MVQLNVNGRSFTVDADPDTPLLYLLRNDLQLNSPKFGCGLSQCGACTVIVDGRAVRSCVTPASRAEGVEIVTLEGLGTAEAPHPIQEAFIAEQAAQCGYCISGMIMTAKAFIDANPTADEGAIRESLERNICRCATHLRILRAVNRYAQEQRA